MRIELRKVSLLIVLGASMFAEGKSTVHKPWGMGTEYYVVGTQENLNDGNPAFYCVPQVTIIAQRNGTSVSITPSTKTSGEHAASVPYTVTMNAGDVYYVTTPADPYNDASHRVFS